MIPSHGTTDHDAALALAAAAIDWSLSAEDEKALETHLKACPACRGRVAALQADSRSLRLLDLGDAPQQVADRVAIHAGKTLRRERGMSRGTALLAAAAVLLVTIAGTILGGVGGRSGEPGDTAEPTPRFVATFEGGAAGAADRPVPVGASPFDRGGVLHCSGILQMSPPEAEQTLRGLGYRVRWQLNQSPSVLQDSLNGIVDPIIVFPGVMPHPDGTLVLWILPSGNPSAEPMPYPDDCPPLADESP